MPKTRAQKEVELTKLTKSLDGSKAAIVAEFKNLSMDDLTTFRKKAKAQQVKLQIVKNTLLAKAAEAVGIKDWQVRKVKRQLAVATYLPDRQAGGQDEIMIAKLVYEFAKSSNDRVKIYSGIIDKRVAPLDLILQLAQLPSREELLAKIVGSLSAPISSFVRAINGPLQGFYNVVKSLQEAK